MSVGVMNDTFDNLTFSNISNDFLQTQQSSENYNKNEENSVQKQIDWFNSDKNVTFDDSIFFTTTLSQTAAENPTEPQVEPDLSLNQTICSESDDLFDLNDSLRNISGLDDKQPPDKSQLFSQSWRTSDAEASFNQLSPIKPKTTTETSPKLSLWGLPAAILAKYEAKNITTMFPWQVECLSNEKILKNHSNLVYSAPTSAGKTLISEIIAIKTIFEREKKAIFILPFVSVVREKTFYFQEIFSGSGVRVEGFMGSYNPPGGFTSVNLAICTIEKANSLVNKLLVDGNMAEIGAVIIDELHLLGDPHRGYLLELLLTKLRYLSLRNISIQIVGMSATLPNLQTLASWLHAELYVTHFRPIPLLEQAQICEEIVNCKLEPIRRVSPLPELQNDTDNILQLCLETICSSCSVLIFCPTKNWCENLSQQISAAFFKLGSSDDSPLGRALRSQLDSHLISELLTQLKFSPVGLDAVLRKTCSFGVAFHHAGLTIDERDIIEAAFRNGTLRVLVATSTLSSGVNLPARRVIIRTPIFHGGKPIDTLTYRQMIGRAGRMGKDTAGESILICQKKDAFVAAKLMSAELDPIESCLESDGRLKRAILEAISSGMASTREDVEQFTQSTLFAVQNSNFSDSIAKAMEFLTRNEFVRVVDAKYSATNLGKACLTSSLPPEEGLALFTELDQARQCFVLETELHLIYLVTPYSACYQWSNIDWIFYLDLWEKLPKSMKKVGELVGVKEGFLVLATRGKLPSSSLQQQHKLMVHKRFFVALALQDLVNEKPLGEVCDKFNCNRGMLQSLQQSAATFAGMVTAFSRELGWSSVEILVGQFQDRLSFGVSRDLLDLMRLPLLNGKSARALYDADIATLAALANASQSRIEEILHKVMPFESGRKRENETEFQRRERNKFRNIWITGREGLTEREAAQLLVTTARTFLQLEMGLKEAKWDDSGSKATDLELTGLSDLELSTNSEKDEFRTPNPPPANILKVSTSLNSSSDLVTNSQDESQCYSVAEMTLRTLRKRRATLNNASFEDSPNKRKKLTQTLFADRTIPKLQHFEIVEVCRSLELLQKFQHELKAQQVVSMCVSCKSMPKNAIGIVPSEEKPVQFAFKNKRVEGVALCWGGSTAFYINLEENSAGMDLIQSVCGNSNVTVKMFDCKEQIKVLKRCCRVDFKCKLEDAKVLDWLLQPEGNEKKFQAMVVNYCASLADLARAAGATRGAGSLGLDASSTMSPKIRSCSESLSNWYLVDVLKRTIRGESRQLLSVFENEMACIKTVAKMELNGIGINTTFLASLVTSINSQRGEIEKKAHSLAGHRFSFTSSKDVAKVLGVGKSAKCRTSITSRRNLEKSEHPISELILEYRKLTGIVNKTLEPLLRAAEGDRVHGTCIMHTLTGRISMHEPNLQNVAKDFSISSRDIVISCRDAFQARDGFLLVSADYCQLELRLLAHFSRDEALCGIMRGEGDVFTSIAAKWNRVSEENVSGEMRQRAKFICYGIIYGMGAKALAQQMEIDENEASVFMEAFRDTYPGVKQYVKDVVEECRRKGFVKTLSGRKRHLPLINSEHQANRSQAERQAVNTTVQGSAADLVKKCMVEMDEKCRQFRNNRPKLVLHLHDELLYEVSASHLRRFAAILKETMEASVNLSIPFPVKVKAGPSWGKLTEYKL